MVDEFMVGEFTFALFYCTLLLYILLNKCVCVCARAFALFDCSITFVTMSICTVNQHITAQHVIRHANLRNLKD